jgi:tRNA dimethylallyltransferase
MDSQSLKFIAITGPTGSGKSGLAIKVVQALGLDRAEIVSCDSVQVYRGFDIGSAKESMSERQGICNHLVDCVDPLKDEEFDAAQYSRVARDVIFNLNKQGKIAVVVGGTGLYLRALTGENFHQLPKDDAVRAELSHLSNLELYEKLKDLDAERAEQIHLNDRVRLLRALELVTILGRPISQVLREKKQENSLNQKYDHPPLFQIFINPDRKALHDRIAQRSQKMLDMGLVEEVKSLLNAGCRRDSKPMQSIGYLQVIKMLDGEIIQDELLDRIIFATRQYAKRQCTWFSKTGADFQLETAEITPEIRLKLENDLVL